MRVADGAVGQRKVLLELAGMPRGTGEGQNGWETQTSHSRSCIGQMKAKRASRPKKTEKKLG